MCWVAECLCCTQNALSSSAPYKTRNKTLIVISDSNLLISSDWWPNLPSFFNQNICGAGWEREAERQRDSNLWEKEDVRHCCLTGLCLRELFLCVTTSGMQGVLWGTTLLWGCQARQKGEGTKNQEGQPEGPSDWNQQRKEAWKERPSGCWVEDRKRLLLGAQWQHPDSSSHPKPPPEHFIDGLLSFFHSSFIQTGKIL